MRTSRCEVIEVSTCSAPRLAGHNLVCSMSAVGHCGENAAAEGFFGMLKRERVNRRYYRRIDEARNDVFDYIERFHNQKSLALT